MALHSTSTTPRWTALKRKDLRRSRRYAVDNPPIRVSWLDTEGHLKMAQVKILNICEHGLAIDLPEPPLRTSMVRFQGEKFGLVGAGAVRHFQKVGSRWVVGVEFEAGLKWVPPDGDVDEPIPLCSPE